MSEYPVENLDDSKEEDDEKEEYDDEDSEDEADAANDFIEEDFETSMKNTSDDDGE